MSPSSPFRPALEATLAPSVESLTFDDEAPDLVVCLDRLAHETTRFGSPFDRAFVGGFLCDRIGTAFGHGYVEALAALAPLGASRPRAAFAVTEAAGGHPKAIATTLERESDDMFRIDGEKSFVTLAGAVEILLVAVSEGLDEQGRNRLRVVRVPVDAPGVALHEGPKVPFAPEIPHGRVTFDSVLVTADEVLPGDGYTRYVKPFRTIEDLHVHAALLGHLLRVARRFDFPRAAVLELLASAVSLRGLASEPPLAPSTHLALAGAIAGFERLLEELAPAFEHVEAGVKARFERDSPLRRVASKVRAQRLEAAWATVGSDAVHHES